MILLTGLGIHFLGENFTNISITDINIIDNVRLAHYYIQPSLEWLF
jgi:hypothetical protein